jgi:hypothetical protein
MRQRDPRARRHEHSYDHDPDRGRAHEHDRSQESKAARDDMLNEGSGHGDFDGGPGNDLVIGGPDADGFMISPDIRPGRVTDFRAGPDMFDHLALMNIEPEQFKFQDTRAGVLISWDTAQGDGSVLLAGVWKRDLAQGHRQERSLLRAPRRRWALWG